MKCYRIMASAVTALSALAASSSIWASGDHKDVYAKSFDVALQPGKFHEECMELKAGQEMPYHFKASTEVAFNIHFHKGKAVEFPVKVDAIRESAQIFKPMMTEHFCWMWKNNASGPAQVKGIIGAK